MNWSAYSQFVGDVFGAPLAHRRSRRVLPGVDVPRAVALRLERAAERTAPADSPGWSRSASALSAAFIMAANSWMQHPVGYQTDAATGRPELASIGAMFTNPVFVWGYLHVILASLVTGATIMLAVSAWHLRRGHAPFVRSARLAIVGAAAGVGAGARWSEAGSASSRTTYQPMKIAAAEAQWETCQPCSFSRLPGRWRQRTTGHRPRSSRSRTCCRCWPPAPGTGRSKAWPRCSRSTRSSTAKATTCRTSSSSTGPCDSWPTSAACSSCFAGWGAWLAWRRRLTDARRFLAVAVWAVVAPFVMNTAGWLLTESGRQPWIVQGLMKTSARCLSVGQHDRDRDQPGAPFSPSTGPGRGEPVPDAPVRAP